MSEQPSEKVIQAVEEAQRLRGWIANGYAQVEFLLGNIIVLSLSMPEYEQVGGVLPHGSPDRIRRVRRILQFAGVFSEFDRELTWILDEFENHHETRDLLAHGFCEVHHTPDGEFGFSFRKWHRVSDRHDAQLQRTFRLTDLEHEKTVIGEISQRALKLSHRIHERLGLIAS